MGLGELILVAVIAVVAAGIMFWALIRARLNATRQKPLTIADSAGPIFLFQDKVLIDATPDALAMLPSYTSRMTEYEATLHVLAPHFPDLRNRIAALEDGHDQIAYQRGEGLQLALEQRKGILRIAVKGTVHAERRDMIDHDVRIAELDMLRDIIQHTPQLIWREDKAGKLIWANHAYLAFSDMMTTSDKTAQATWPDKSIFPETNDSVLKRGNAVRRVSITQPDKKAEHWFDVTSVAQPDGFLHFASDANAVVRADQERRNFVQTLSKTFAQLSTGLAIFDKRRQLAMFNPALLDMTNLPFEFLSSLPSIDTVLDKLRESRMLPEPKDYVSWRDRFTAVEAAAKDGTYCENWNLPAGQTYRVTGRPHPDGAFAFLFEDISVEVSQTRRFRSDIETAQSVLDSLPEAIAVFSSAGTLVMSNSAYANLWSTCTSISIEQREIGTEIDAWRTRCTPTGIWSELRNFVHTLGTRQSWSKTAILYDGRRLRCQANPLSGGMTMVQFSIAGPAQPVIQKLTSGDPAIRMAKR
ncbi:PAS-domain containing protein [Loktanella agnita]|uniref:PAS-domain containing protein n=1 Tax=Loktanella agnita TaxID=287097 RepID=UPI0039880605